MECCSHDSDLVGHIEGILITCQFNVGLLQSLGSDESVDLLNLDPVKSLDGLLDLSLVGLFLDYENESVVVLDGLDGRLGAEWVLHDIESVVGLLLDTSQWILWDSLLDEGLWSLEGSLGPDLGLAGLVDTSLHSSSSLSSSSLPWHYIFLLDNK